MNKFFISFLFCISLFGLNALEEEKLNCIILLNREEIDNVGNTSSYYLMSKLQSSLAEESTPILVHTSLWNAFIERRVSFEQNAKRLNTKEEKITTLLNRIKKRFVYWSNFYNQTSDDISQNKALVVQRINEEFYDAKDRVDVSDVDYQLLLNLLTVFIPEDWCIYKKAGFHLLIPKKYLALHASAGFKLFALEEVSFAQDIVSNYFDSHDSYSLVKALPEFFQTYVALQNQTMPYAWNIVISGHGGSIYKEKNSNNVVTWNGEPLIADLTVQEFRDVLHFFQTQLKTHMLHYSGCYSGGNHIQLAFENEHKQTYNFAIICDCLTDCATYCKTDNRLPSWQQQFLTVDDVYYDSEKNSWAPILKSPYHWDAFFNSISGIDFSIESIERLPTALSNISYSVPANISLLRRPGTDGFYPLTSSGVFKIDARFINRENENKDQDVVVLHGVNVLLIERECINTCLEIDNEANIRIISIKPGDALHYIKRLRLANSADLPSMFWQAEFQIYNKTFLLDECELSYCENSPFFRDIAPNGSNIIIKNVVVTQQKHLIRLFFTVNDDAIMVVANKLSHYELDKNADIQEVIKLSPEAKQKYEKYYISQKNSFFHSVLSTAHYVNVHCASTA